MTTIDAVMRDHSAVIAAIEDLHAFQQTVKSFGFGLESMDSSNAMTAALEEEATEKKKNFFQRILAFFRNIYEKVKAWASARMERNRNSAAEKVREVVAKAKEGRKAAPGAVKNLEKEFEQQASALFDDAIKLLQDPAFLNSEFKTLAGEYGALTAIATSAQEGQELMRLITTIRANLDQSMAMHHSAVQNAKEGREQATAQTARMNEILATATDASRKLSAQATAISQVQPKNLLDIFAAISNEKALTGFCDQADFSSFEKRLDEMEADLGPFLKLFEEIANSDPASLSAQAKKIYDVNPSTLMALSQTPMYFMSVIGRVSTATSQVTPSTLVDVPKIAASVVRKAMGDKNAPQVSENVTDMVTNYIYQKV